MNEEFMITNTALVGVAVSVTGGIVAASHTYSKERKNVPPTFDYVDYIILIMTGTFSGFMGWLVASWKLEEVTLIYATAGLSAIGGYNMLVQVKEILIDTVKTHLDAKSKE